MTDRDSSAVAELRRLSDDPAAQARHAASLLQSGQRRDVVDAALKVLTMHPQPEARAVLRQFYQYQAADGPKRDPGGYLRREVLDALRPVATYEDLPLLLAAVETYEFLPPGFREEAIPVRIGGLLILNEVDATLARYHAARLLVDSHMDTMSGEPALTAARVLASQEELTPLYLYALDECGSRSPEVVAECLRSLVLAPQVLVGGILAHFKDTRDAVILLGLFDLLIRHRDGPQALDFLASALSSRLDLDVFRYLVIALLSSRRAELTALVQEATHLETDPARRAILDEGLALLRPAETSAPARRRRRRAFG